MLFVRFVLFCTDTTNQFLTRNCAHISGAIAFYSLFSFFPLVLAVISIAGYVSGSDEQQATLAEGIGSVVPVSTEFVSETVQGVVSARAITGAASIVALLWASTAAFGAVRKGVNAAWGIRKTRPFLRERMMDLGLVIGAGVLLTGTLFITPILTFLEQISDTIAPEADPATDLFWGLVPQLLAPGLSFLAFLLLYRFLPNTKVRLADVWLGALLAAMAFQGATWGFVLYIKTFPIHNAVYGTVGAIMALLTWVYVSAIILLLGALVTSRYASYPYRVRGEQGIRLLWTGLTRVRLRVVAIPAAG